MMLLCLSIDLDFHFRDSIAAHAHSTCAGHHHQTKHEADCIAYMRLYAVPYSYVSADICAYNCPRNVPL